MLQISDDAVEALSELGPLRLTIGAVEGDEAELEIEPADEPAEGDEVVENGGARVFLDAEAAEALADQILEVEPHGDHVHFGFSPQSA